MLTNFKFLAFFVVLLAVSVATSAPAFAQDTKRATIVGRVIGIRRPDLGWIMHTTNLDLLYVRVEKVVKGRMASQYIQLGYPYNDKDKRLPADILDGKSLWLFENIGRFDEWDSTVLVGLTDDDWAGKPISNPDGSMKESAPDGQWDTMPILCAPVKGFETEAKTLEVRGVIKAYFLGGRFEKPNLRRLRSGTD